MEENKQDQTNHDNVKDEYLSVNKRMVDIFMASLDLEEEEYDDAMKEWNELNTRRWELYAKMVEERKKNE